MLKGCLIPLLLLLLVGFTACGTSPFTTGQQAAASHPTKNLTGKVNPCSLISQSQVEQVLKTSLSMTPPQRDPQGNYLQENPCNYANPNDINGASAQIFLTTFSDTVATRADFHTFATLTGSDFHSVAGIGEQALLAAQPIPVLYVQQDNGILTVGVASNASAAVVEDQEQQLAQIAVQKM